MNTNPYPPEDLSAKDQWGDPLVEDNGTMPDNVASLAEAVIGHRIVKAERTKAVDTSEYSYRDWEQEAFVLTLDDGTQVRLFDSSDCCAYTELQEFLLHPDKVDHVIMGVATTEGYTKWHIYADYGDVLELTVGWSAGNPFYYGYGFNICVVPVGEVTP